MRVGGAKLDQREAGARRAGALVRLFGLVAAVMGWSCTSPGDDPGPALPVDPAALYAQMCVRCHGVDGRGDPEIKKTMAVRDFSSPEFQARAASEDLARTIMAGKGQMPAFGGLLSAPKIQSLSGFVRRLGRAASKPH